MITACNHQGMVLISLWNITAFISIQGWFIYLFFCQDLDDSSVRPLWTSQRFSMSLRPIHVWKLWFVFPDLLFHNMSMTNPGIVILESDRAIRKETNITCHDVCITSSASFLTPVHQWLWNRDLIRQHAFIYLFFYNAPESNLYPPEVALNQVHDHRISHDSLRKRNYSLHQPVAIWNFTICPMEGS